MQQQPVEQCEPGVAPPQRVAQQRVRGSGRARRNLLRPDGDGHRASSHPSGTDRRWNSSTTRSPVRPGRVLTHGRVVRRVDDVAHLEATLVDPRRDTVAATATAVARVVPLAAAASAV